jgi:hypothetical protein
MLVTLPLASSVADTAPAAAPSPAEAIEPKLKTLAEAVIKAIAILVWNFIEVSS